MICIHIIGDPSFDAVILTAAGISSEPSVSAADNDIHRVANDSLSAMASRCRCDVNMYNKLQCSVEKKCDRSMRCRPTHIKEKIHVRALFSIMKNYQHSRRRQTFCTTVNSNASTTFCQESSNIRLRFISFSQFETFTTAHCIYKCVRGKSTWRNWSDLESGKLTC